MAYLPKRLYTGQPGTTITTLYTVPASTKVIVKQIVVTNVTATAATFSLHLVPNGASATVANAIAITQTVDPYSSQYFDLNQVLDTVGDTIQALIGTTVAITLAISGVTF